MTLVLNGHEVPREVGIPEEGPDKMLSNCWAH
jgi:hypothetical protein